MIIRFVKRQIDNGDGTVSTRTILQQLVPTMWLVPNSTGGTTMNHG